MREWMVPGFQVTEASWLAVLDSFLRDSTLLAVSRETGVKPRRLHGMLTLIRQVMLADLPPRFHGPVEADDAFLGPRWHNRRSWQKTTRRGRGTDQQPVIGLFDQHSGKVAAALIPKVEWPQIQLFLRERADPGATLFTDTYTAYKPAARNGYDHLTVDHVSGEYVRGKVTVNHIESFWGYLKRHFKVTGGLRRSRLKLYLGEWVWLYNFRSWSRETKVKRLLYRLKDLKV